MSKVIVYTKHYCSFCRWAKGLLQSKNVEFEEIDITDDPKLQLEVQRISNRRMVPQIFIDGKSLGGFEELRALDASGELDRLLERSN